MHTHTHTRTHIYIYKGICVCICICIMYMYMYRYMYIHILACNCYPCKLLRGHSPTSKTTERFHDSDHMRHAETGWRSLIYEHLGSADQISPVAPKAPSRGSRLAFCTEVPLGWGCGQADRTKPTFHGAIQRRGKGEYSLGCGLWPVPLAQYDAKAQKSGRW